MKQGMPTREQLLALETLKAEFVGRYPGPRTMNEVAAFHQWLSTQAPDRLPPDARHRYQVLATYLKGLYTPD